MKLTVRRALVIGLITLVTYLLLLPEYKSVVYLGRAALWGESDTDDYRRFAYREINNGGAVFHFTPSLREDYIHDLLQGIVYEDKGNEVAIVNAEDFLVSSYTTAFIVIQDDSILYEGYLNGASRESINTSFSAAKSFVSFLVGKAVEDGFIESIEEPMTNYITELHGKGFESISIRELLMMSSGIEYREGRLTAGDDAKTYYSPNLRELALRETRVVGPSGLNFWYNNYHPLLLGIILERATGTSVAHYLQETLWKPLGMEYPASWSIDSQKHGFEKMESGLNARSIDYARFGRLFLEEGNWQGRQIISQDWIHASTTAPPHIDHTTYYTNYPSWPVFHRDGGYYQYQWWGYHKEADSHDFYAHGKFGQVIYVSPANRVVIVRNGTTNGGVDWWPAILRDLAARIGAN